MGLSSQGLTERVLKVGGSVVRKASTPEVAERTRDSLAKGIYVRMFDVLVATINAELERVSSVKDTDPNWDRSVGLLDLFGFESFLINSFEQLCINYANEKLQQESLNCSE